MVSIIRKIIATIVMFLFVMQSGIALAQHGHNHGSMPAVMISD